MPSEMKLKRGIWIHFSMRGRKRKRKTEMFQELCNENDDGGDLTILEARRRRMKRPFWWIVDVTKIQRP